MTTIEIARTFANHGQTADARRAYTLVLQAPANPDEEWEAASYLLDNGGDYRIAYTTFQSLYNRGQFQEDLLDLMVRAFYEPNVKTQEKRYQKNRKLLQRYPYLFRKDFLPFDQLPIQFFPYDDKGFTPFFKEENRFGPYFDPNHPVISRNFFRDLEKPILAQDAYSQYELAYLRDNVRKSQWVARDNHIYLHYSDWATFCAYLPCLDLRELLKDEKFVFLIEEERTLYPIDFKERFGIDYSQFTVQPFSVREVKRLIWQAQLSAHNGGDFFVEIFHGHPNILTYQTIMFDNVQESIQDVRRLVKRAANAAAAQSIPKIKAISPGMVRQLALLKDLTDKDILVGLFLGNPLLQGNLDPNARISPALYFQPHFANIFYGLSVDSRGRSVLDSQQYEAIQSSPIFRGFPYIKTFTPLRRPTTSYAATVKYMWAKVNEAWEKETQDQESRDPAETTPQRSVMIDSISDCVLNRSFMIDWQDRLFQDCVLVRFEDGKLNPRATFTALAAFLDIPYTESMTYCSGLDGLNPESLPGFARGFDPAPVYRAYDEYINDAERQFLEFFMRDVYQTYGYQFQYYDGGPVDLEKAQGWIDGFSTLDGYIRESCTRVFEEAARPKGAFGWEAPSETEKTAEIRRQTTLALVEERMEAYRQRRLQVAELMLGNLRFVNKRGQPLHMMPPLKLDPGLLEQPLYH